MNETSVVCQSSDDIGKLLLRLVLGILILFHGISKVLHGPGFILQVVTGAGLPAAFGYLVYIGEIVAPLMLIFGVYARAGGLIVAINMVVAILLVHTKQFFTLNDTGGWALELQGMYLGTAIVIFLLGAGRFRVGPAGKWN
jgi:putative oxidoreductase